MRIDQLKANPLTFLTNNVERMRITSAGNVGIGTTSPQAYGGFAIQQQSNTSGHGIAVVDSTTAQSVKLWVDSTNSYLSSGNTGADPLILNTGGGNVGINTTSPETKLHVKATSNLLAPIIVQGASVNGFNLISDRALNGESFTNLGVQYSGGAMVLGSFVKPSNVSQSDATGYLSSYDGGSIKRSAIVVEGSAGNIKFLNTNTSATVAIDSPVAMTERMRINSSGNVGINTTAPDALLSVNGVASFGDGTALLPSIANFGDLNTGMWFPADDTIAFSTGGGERMRIKSDGNVGIGTSSPLYKLDVPSVSGARFSKSNVFLGKEVTIINSPGQTKTIEIATAGGGAYFKVIITGIYVPGSNLWSTYEYEKVYVNSLAVGGNSAIYTVLNQSVGSFQFQAGDFVISRPGSGVVRIVYTENASNNGNIYLNVNVIGLGGYGVPSAITIT
jgi:hypothetical protein